MKKRTTLVIIILMIVTSNFIYAQNIAIGIRFTPAVLAKSYVENNSPVTINGANRIAFDAGIYATKYVGERIGIRGGWDWGIVDWELYINSPEGAAISEVYLNSENYFYKAFSFALLYKLNIKNDSFEFSAGPSFRYYRWEDDPQGLGFNLPASNFEVDVVIDALGSKIYTSIPLSVNYLITTGNKTNLKIGLMHNLTFNPIADSRLTINTNGETYTGKFSPRTSYWGLNMQFEYNLTSGLFKPVSLQPTANGKYRKSLFAEISGNGIGITGNFDMRLKANQNNGLGFRVGAGSGGNYFSDDNETINKYISLPLGLNYILGNKRSGFETGIGITPQFAVNPTNDGTKTKADGFLNIGYRFQPINKGVMFRTTWTPGVNRSGIYADEFGISVGYSF